jgi:hypothetical protein
VFVSKGEFGAQFEIHNKSRVSKLWLLSLGLLGSISKAVSWLTGLLLLGG